ncbi:MAG: MotA/TolQ/ExbB proton channel family protein [Oligoflexia bacterium]
MEISATTAPAWLWLTQWGSRAVLLILVGLSVTSIAVILDRRKLLKHERQSDALGPAQQAIRSGSLAAVQKTAQELIQNQKMTASFDSGHPPIIVGYLLLLSQRLSRSSERAIDRSTRSYLVQSRARLEKGMTLLATVGSNAPFIGLFGTVLGIIQAFGELSSQQGGTGSVMGAISEALIATAVGLLVAIPAVIAFNVFQKQSKEILSSCEILRDEFVSSFIAPLVLPETTRDRSNGD